MSRGPRKIPTPLSVPEGMSEPVLVLSAQEAPLRPEAVFARQAPLEVEIGSGKGNTLLQLAGDHPEVDFLGIEIGNQWVRLARSRLIRAAATNARLIAGEAEWILSRYLPPGSVARFHIYFPDPWPKKRHAKRRLFRPGFPPLLLRCLASPGEVRVATDHAGYFEQIVEVMETGGLTAVPGAGWSEAPVSAFERKYREQGRAIHRAVFQPSVR